MRDDFSPLLEADHWLGWLGLDPAALIREEVADILRTQDEGSELRWLRITDTPRFLTGGKPGDGKVVVVRTGLAAPFELVVKAGNGEDFRLTGIFTWVAGGLDAERADRVWLDLGMDLAAGEAALATRIYEL